MAALLTVTELRAYVETDLTDVALARLLDAADMDIQDAAGDHAQQLWTEFSSGWDQRIYPPRPIATMTTLQEAAEQQGEFTTLAADDYRILMDGRVLQRLSTGTNPRTTWGKVIEADYVPEGDDERRILATIDLVKLALRFTGVASESVGEYQEQTTLFMLQQKRRILAGLKKGSPWA